MEPQYINSREPRELIIPWGSGEKFNQAMIGQNFNQEHGYLGIRNYLYTDKK